MTRRVAEHAAMSVERERLKVITIFERGINKEQVKKLNQYSKRHHVLIQHSDKYEFKN